ncbi:hypothetical protein C8J55DRAFT_165892 [Lentinula edodes]|uniref:Uncharacterized protein n=1 Tax=Lentinula lateritia TaxID=40482 RepID=A0A9W9DZV7_9AGAR|nr:hypothetical protein C8J55DRAFT_165892 [Lentinula edodes]
MFRDVYDHSESTRSQTIPKHPKQREIWEGRRVELDGQMQVRCHVTNQPRLSSSPSCSDHDWAFPSFRRAFYRRLLQKRIDAAIEGFRSTHSQNQPLPIASKRRTVVIRLGIESLDQAQKHGISHATATESGISIIIPVYLWRT